MNMNRHCGIIKFILLGVVCISLLPVSVHAQKYTEFIPGEVWKDTDGNPINAHGGGLLYHDGTYYWYGEYKKGKTILPDWATWECYRTDVTGVQLYPFPTSTKCWEQAITGTSIIPQSSSSIRFIFIFYLSKIERFHFSCQGIVIFPSFTNTGSHT